MKNMNKLLAFFIALTIVFFSVAINTSAFDYPEIEYHFYKGFCYTRFFDEDGTKTKEGYVRILYYKGKKTKVTVPKKIKGKKVFSVEGYGKIKTLHIPNNIKILNIGRAENLKKITVNKSNKKYSVKNNMLFNKKKTVLYWCKRSIKNPKIPTSVKTIGEFAFCGSQIKTLNIPKNVKTIKRYAFSSCEKLEKVNFNKNIKTIENAAFNNCVSLKTIEIPDSVKTLGGSVFQLCENLEDIKIGNNIKELKSAFFGCKKLESVVFPKSIEKIIGTQFYYCDSLKSVYIYNKDCYIEPNFDKDIVTIPKHVTIYGYEYSTAQEYAEKNGNEFVVLK